MKPLTLTTVRRRDSFDYTVDNYRRSPITDYNYQSVAFGESGGRFAYDSPRSLWNIASNYLKVEARHDFQTEAILFAFISITAALPLINNGHALIEFVRAICSH